MKRLTDKLVVLDAGHGGHDPGAVNRRHDIEEADAALNVAKHTARYLEPYCRTHLTRDTDEFLTLSERPAIANRLNADLFVSKHFNSSTSSKTALSYEVYTTRGQNRSDKAAQFWVNRYGAMFPEKKLRADRRDGDDDKESNFAVIRRTKCPSYLTEDEFIHTDEGAKFIKDPENQRKMGLAQAQAIGDFFGFVVEEFPEETLDKESSPAPVAPVVDSAVKPDAAEGANDLRRAVARERIGDALRAANWQMKKAQEELAKLN